MGAVAGTGAGLAAAFWVYKRNQARAVLVGKLENSGRVQKTRVAVQAGLIPSWPSWLTDEGGLQTYAENTVRLTNTVTAEEAFEMALASLPAIPLERTAAVLPGLVDRGVNAINEALGIQIPGAMSQQLQQQLAKTEQGKAAEEMLSATQGLWWLPETQAQTKEAKPNIAMRWDHFLAGVRR